MPDSGADLSRRTFLEASAGAVARGALGGDMTRQTVGRPAATPLKGRLKQSVCQWCYDKLPLDDLCKAAADIGLKSVELLGEHQWSVPKK